MESVTVSPRSTSLEVRKTDDPGRVGFQRTSRRRTLIPSAGWAVGPEGDGLSPFGPMIGLMARPVIVHAGTGFAPDSFLDSPLSTEGPGIGAVSV